MPTRSAALLFNPMAGRRRAPAVAVAVQEALSALGWQVRCTPTEAPGTATPMARQLAQSGTIDAVFALGGDGTLREVAVGLLGTPVALGPLPGGTTNVLVRSLGLPPDPVATAQRLATGSRARWRVGRCGSTPFLMMVSAGYDAEVVRRMDGAAKARWGQLAVGLLGLRVWWRYSYPRFDVLVDGDRLPSRFAAVSNLPLYGGSFVLAPHADPTAQRLELIVHSGSGRIAAAGFARDLVTGRHLRRPDVEYRSVQDVEIRGPDQLSLQIDGDPCTEALPVRIGLADAPLQVLVG